MSVYINLYDSLKQCSQYSDFVWQYNDINSREKSTTTNWVKRGHITSSDTHEQRNLECESGIAEKYKTEKKLKLRES